MLQVTSNYRAAFDFQLCFLKPGFMDVHSSQF